MEDLTEAHPITAWGHGLGGGSRSVLRYHLAYTVMTVLTPKLSPALRVSNSFEWVLTSCTSLERGTSLPREGFPRTPALVDSNDRSELMAWVGIHIGHESAEQGAVNAPLRVIRSFDHVADRLGLFHKSRSWLRCPPLYLSKLRKFTILNPRHTVEIYVMSQSTDDHVTNVSVQNVTQCNRSIYSCECALSKLPA